MWCDVDPDKVSALQTNDEEGIEQVEANGRGNERNCMAAMSGAGLRRKVRHPGLACLPAPWKNTDGERELIGKKMTRVELLRLIRRLPEGAPTTDAWWSPATSRIPNKRHWVGWLEEYDGPGFYNRKRPSADRDAQFIYNHLHCPPMLCWLAEQS